MKHTLFITAIVVAHGGLASADETADSALKHAQAALKAGRIHEACDAFATSEKLAANVDTEIALAACYEQDGKPMSAARLFRSTADKDTNLERRKTSSAKAAKLEARAPKLRFAINPLPPGLIVKVDGVEVSSTADAPVDTGPHEVVATAPGYEGHASAPVDRERAIVDVIVRMEPHAEPAPTPAPTPAPAPAPAPVPPPTTVTPAVATPSPIVTQTEPSVDHRKRNAYIIGGAGVGMLVVAGILYEASSSKFDDEHALCPRSQCKNSVDLAKAQSLISDSRTLGGVSIGMGIGGAVVIGAGVYLLLTPHKQETHVAVQLDHGGGSLGYVGRF